MVRLFLYIVMFLADLQQANADAKALREVCDPRRDTCTTPNAQCKGTAGTGGHSTCECQANFYESTGSCISVLGSQCTADSDDCTNRGLINSVCSTSGGSSTCTCISGYYGNSNACSRVLGSSCRVGSAGNNLCATTRGLTNSKCTTDSCTCKPGYVPNDLLTTCSSAGRTLPPFCVWALLTVLTIEPTLLL